MCDQHHNERQRRPGGWRRDVLFLATSGLAAVVLTSALLPEAPGDQPLADTSRRRAAGPRRQSDAVVQAVDASLRAGDGEQFPTAGSADRLAVARRLWLSLMGTIPSLEEIRQLESGRIDTSAESTVESLVDLNAGQPVADAEIDRMLDHIFADPRHADYLAERLARAYVGVEDGPFLLFRRRRFTAWLSDELLENRRYDAIVREMITARGLWTDQPAANFITVALVEDNDDDRLNESLLTSRMSRALLGVRLDCAECHDHPFAEWTLRDFQGLAAFFAGTTSSLGGIRDDNTPYEVEDRESGEPLTITPAVPFAEELLPTAGNHRDRLARWLTSRDNRAFARATVNRVWAMMLGRPLVEPMDDIPTGDDVPTALDRLADNFAAEGYNLRSLIRTIAHTEAFRRASRTAADPAAADDAVRMGDVWTPYPLTRLRPEQVVGALLQSAKVQTIDRESHILVQIARSIQQREFIERYGDSGAEELDPRVGTIPQRLVMMNGQLVTERSGEGPLRTVARIALLSPDDAAAIETTYLAVLTRRPTPPELAHFSRRLAETDLPRVRVLEDLYWSLVNSTEFSWNH